MQHSITRWENIPKEKILYKFCNDGIGDEFHYLFTCKSTDINLLRCKLQDNMVHDTSNNNNEYKILLKLRYMCI
jgi:hypothetical protein